MPTEKPLGEIVRAIPALMNLMSYIESRAASIYVRDYIDGQVGKFALADLPAERALHWGFAFLQTCTIPVTVAGDSNKPPIAETVCDDPKCLYQGGDGL